MVSNINSKRSGLFPLLILPVIWGSYYVASQKLVEYTSVFTSGVAIRFLTLVLLTGIMWKRKEFGDLLRTKGILKRLILIGTLGFLLDLTAFLGLSMSSAASGTALLKCDVLMVNILSMIIYHQRFSWKVWGCTFVMLFGVFLVMGFDFASFRISDPGNLFFLLSAFFVSLNVFVIKSVQTDKNATICDDAIAYYNNFITMIYFTAASLIAGTFGQLKLVLVDGKTCLAWLLASIGQTLIYFVYYYNLRNYPVWLVKTCLLLMPLVSSLITLVLFGETLAWSQYVGMAIVIFGAFGILLSRKNAKKLGGTHMKLIIGSDKSGFTLKEAVKAHLLEKGHIVEDCGTQDLEHVKPFFETAAALAPKIQSGEYEKGILICGTGAGMAIVANKFKGVYAMACTDTYDARMCRAINDANVITMGGWKLAPEVACEMADIFLSTDFTEGLEEWRQEFLKGAKTKVEDLETKIYG